jgi:hypothetical protein
MLAKAVTVTATYKAITGIAETLRAASLRAWIHNGLLHVEGLTVSKAWYIYNVSGALVYQAIAVGNEADMALPAPGVYIIQSEERTTKVSIGN